MVDIITCDNTNDIFAQSDRLSEPFRKIISSFSGEKTILFSSHLLSEVQSLCSRVVILNHGNLISDTNLHDKARQRKLRASIDMEKNALVSALSSLDVFEQVQPVQDAESGFTTVILTCKNDSSAPEKELFTLLSGLKAPLIRLMPVSFFVSLGARLLLWTGAAGIAAGIAAMMIKKQKGKVQYS